MNFPLLDMAARGSLAFVLVWGLDSILCPRMNASRRRIWWLLVPLAFLLPVHMSIPLPNVSVTVLEKIRPAFFSIPRTESVADAAMAKDSPDTPLPWILLLWAAGVLASLTLTIGQTAVAWRRWSRERFTTDPELLELLEDCRQEAAITAPIGLVISTSVPTPALLGWIRPRILLPAGLAASLPPEQLRAVLLHELAHFRSLDIPLGWLFTLARATHWFNPFAHLAFFRWKEFREEAADEDAIRWMREPTGQTYGHAVLNALENASCSPTPFGSLAIGESIQTLKRRMTMIHHYNRKSPRPLLAGLIALVLAALAMISPSRAQEENSQTAQKAAVQAMEVWLNSVDTDQYAESWNKAAQTFKKAVTSEQWVTALNSVRKPLGACLERKQTSALYQTEIPVVPGQTLKGHFVIAQFDTSFANLKYAVETVTFEKETDGAWRASGYYIKPRP